MARYIELDALVAEIERLQDAIKATAIDDRICKEQAEAYKVCVKLRSFVEDTLEVKEVDIENKKMEWIEQLCKYFKANYLYVSGHESFISDFRRYAKNLK